MGNTGRPSTGCSRCRQRRIKCDERKPGCYRCEKLCEKCPGYPHGQWVFRDENDTAKKRALKRAQIGDVDASHDSSCSNSNKQSPVPAKDQQSAPTKLWISTHANIPSWETPRQTLTVIRPNLLADIEFRSVCLFMENFTLDASRYPAEPSHLDFLPGLYLSPKISPCLHHAVSAVALTNFANRYGAKDVASNAILAYGNALSATNKCLRDPSTANTDSTLAAIYLLSLYELLCHPDLPSVSGVGWGNHVSGSFQILRLRWANRLIKTTTERQLFQLVHTTILIKAIMTYEMPPRESMGFILGQDYPEGIGAKIASIHFCKVVEHRAKIQNAIIASASSADDAIGTLTKVLQEAEVLSRTQSFENWCANEPHWQVKEFHSLHPSPTKRYAFASNAVSQHWIHHWTAVLCMQRSVIDGLHTALSIGDREGEPFTETEGEMRQRITELQKEIENLADKIIGCVEYCLTGSRQESRIPQHWSISASSVGALQIFWPLGTVKHTPFTSTIQKEIATTALKRIGNEMSIAQALLHAYG